MKQKLTLPAIDWKQTKSVARLSAMVAGVLVGLIVTTSVYFRYYRWSYRSPVLINFQSPVIIEKVNHELLSPLPEVEVQAQEVEPEPTPTQTPKPTARKPVGNTQTRVYDLIGEIWGEEADLGRRMADCESTYGTNLENSSSSAVGVFQFLRGTWIEQRTNQGDDSSPTLRYDEAESIKTAFNHYKRMGTSPWKASEHCWGK